MQASRRQIGPDSSVDTANLAPAGSQQAYSDAYLSIALPNAGQHNPPPPYPSSVEHLPCYWWEDGAKNILRGNDLQDIKLVCRFRTYSDENLPREILHTRWPPLLNVFFLNLHGGDRQAVSDLNKHQKIEGILEKLVLPLPSSNPSDIPGLDELLLEDDVSQSALGLNEASCSAFKKIPFSDWARSARDPHELVKIVDDFLDWHGSLQESVESHLRDNPDEMEKYLQMESVGASVAIEMFQLTQIHTSYCPSTVLLVGQCPRVCDTIVGTHIFLNLAINLILNELKAFFTCQKQNHIAAIRQLAILELRFQRMFLNEEEVDWSQRFSTDIDFFEQITTTPAAEIADLLTQLDLKELRLVPPQEFINGKGHRLQHIYRRCNRLCEAIQESILFAEQLSPSVARVAKELHARRNFHSLIPIVQALRETGFDESVLPELFSLINSNRNYYCYRKAYEEAPSVPFLPPHIRQINHCQEIGLSQIYSFLTYKKSEDLPPVQNSGEQEASYDHKQLSWYSLASTWTKLLPCLPIARSTELWL